jgi:hypothetical protein
MAYSTISGMPDAPIERMWESLLEPRWRYKLDLADQEYIASEICGGWETIARASRNYNVSPSTIRAILKRQQRTVDKLIS